MGYDLGPLENPKSDLTIKRTPKQVKEEQQRQSCQQGYHYWRLTFVTGQFLCSVCGIYAYCPGCTLVSPHTNLHSCPTHKGGHS